MGQVFISLAQDLNLLCLLLVAWTCRRSLSRKPRQAFDVRPQVLQALEDDRCRQRRRPRRSSSCRDRPRAAAASDAYLQVPLGVSAYKPARPPPYAGHVPWPASPAAARASVARGASRSAKPGKPGAGVTARRAL